ncbi:hypothetical protein EUTSA_v10029122mg [Eutrema salsugineum]|uniref:Uncharacterized protein n=1 Tax=Eutrema salsugineum TaxID=72664 RepID=V4L7H6_EUTSA|nr:hypothetical protein EUTSA_v10029122mg [Eutrema salsugineum]ESQ38292.1 hypothetical protein EUTSA_v10029122mg [Eutrema salsugineum]
MHSGADVDAFLAALNRDILSSSSLPLVTNPEGEEEEHSFDRLASFRFGFEHSENERGRC